MADAELTAAGRSLTEDEMAEVKKEVSERGAGLRVTAASAWLGRRGGGGVSCLGGRGRPLRDDKGGP